MASCSWRRLVVPALVVWAGSALAQAPAERVLDDFADVSRWHASASDDVRASLRQEPGALCLDFDFDGVSGYAVVQRALDLDFGDNYELSFDLRGDAPVNTLQFKLVDASGENVWWANRPDFEFPRTWQEVRFKKRHISFAWGPARNHSLRHSATLQWVIARGAGGGKGSVCFRRLALRPLPPESAPPTPVLRASSTLPPSRPEDAIDGAQDTAWRSDPQAGPEQALVLDFGRVRELGGLVLRWLPQLHASRYEIEFSDDGAHWRVVRRVADGNGGIDPILLPDAQTRYLRLHLLGGPSPSYALAEVGIKDLDFAASPNAFFEALARDAPRGTYPRGFTGEQSYWTVVGVDAGESQGLLSEDGALEPGPRQPSIEPFMLTGDRLITWADANIGQSLAEGYLPIPSVTWRAGDLTLRITALASGTRARSQILARYTVENTGPARTVTLALAVRPFQVNPPTQALNLAGGVAPLHALDWKEGALEIDAGHRVYPLRAPDRVIAGDFDAGTIPELIASHPAPPVRDEGGLATGVLLFRLDLPAHGARSIGVVVPLAGPPRLPERDADKWMEAQERAVARTWRARLNRVALHLPPSAQPLADTLRTALAHILINRQGPVLRPGARSYARSWIRDGAMMSDALLRLGHADAVREYIEWFAPHQFSNGKVPCCVDDRGADPVTENDSEGELLHLIADAWRYTGDTRWLRTMWPHVTSAAAYMNGQRMRERVDSNASVPRRAYYGLMPASISHEGYSDRPAYSYWDDFWTLAGYGGALDIAQALGEPEYVRRYRDEREQFRGDLFASLNHGMEQHGIDFLPGSADRGDFDPSATTVALIIAGEEAALPQPQLQHTFERYWREFVARRDVDRTWDAYTPYELRLVAAFVRLGWRDRAGELMRFFLDGRRPAAWNQWAEVVGREPRAPRFVGDMPHTWIASDFIRSTLELFAYERKDDGALVLAAGVPDGWLAGNGIAIDRLRTPWGLLSYSMRRDAGRLALHITPPRRPRGVPSSPQAARPDSRFLGNDGPLRPAQYSSQAGLTPPPGGFVLRWPYPGEPGRTLVNGVPAPWDGNELRITTVPADVVIDLPSHP